MNRTELRIHLQARATEILADVHQSVPTPRRGYGHLKTDGGVPPPLGSWPPAGGNWEGGHIDHQRGLMWYHEPNVGWRVEPYRPPFLPVPEVAVSPFAAVADRIRVLVRRVTRWPEHGLRLR